jgi:CDP-diacylglycerol--glycerol-3-phosphate 3-phosphatidyltransferase
VGEPPVDPPARRPLTFRRLSGLDRSGPLPSQQLHDQPWNPWTLPNAIGFLRLALIPVFLLVALSSDDGVDATAAVIFAVIAWTDYLDGITARITGQYSRLGALMDPVIDRLLIVSGVVVCWNFELLPRWALALMALRELSMVLIARLGLRRGFELQVNMVGRWGVWPAMAAPFGAMVGLETAAHVLLYLGLVLTWTATALYLRDGLRSLRYSRAP